MFRLSMGRVSLSETDANWLLGRLSVEAGKETAAKEARLAVISQELGRLRTYLDRAYGDKLEGKITESFWLQKSRAWQEDITRLEGIKRQLEDSGSDLFVTTAKRTLELSKRLKTLYESADPSEKSLLLSTVHSNSTLEHGTLQFYYSKPFSYFLEMGTASKKLPSYDTNQKYPGLMPPFVHWQLLMMQKDEGGGFCLIDAFPLPPEMCRPKRAAYKRKPRPPKPAPPPPPNIQDFLRKAYVFKKRMRDNPELTSEVLAQEVGIDLVQMGKILSLLTLTPATQQAILAMPKEKVAAAEKQIWQLIAKELQ